MKYLVGLCMCVVAASAMGQTLTTAAPNNGSGGVFLDLTPTSTTLFVTQFDVAFSGTVGTTAPVEVWTRSGSYVGFTGSNAGWTLTQTVSAVRGGSLVWVPMVLTTPIVLGPGTTGVLLHCTTTTTGQGIRYTGTSAAPPQTTWSNADLTLFSDVARTGGVPFGGSQFTPRTFSGVVYYSAVPEPMTLAGLGIGFAALLRRRRAK